MRSKRDFLPIALAAIIALLITVVIRFAIPNNINLGNAPVKELPIPEVPLVSKKEHLKAIEPDCFVLVMSSEAKYGVKIKKEMCTWKKWPADGMQPYFIAKTIENTPLNNGADYNNAIGKWAKHDIPIGIPLTMAMLSSEDPVKADQEIRVKKEAELLAKEKKIAEETFVSKGMRAITVPIDQRTASSGGMIFPGEYVDVLIMRREGDRNRTYKYKALKILALDGVTEFDFKQKVKASAAAKEQQRKAAEKGSTMIHNVVSSVTGFSPEVLPPPKNVTLEVKESFVEKILELVADRGVILSIRGHTEKKEKESLDINEEKENSLANNQLLKNAINILESSPIEKLYSKKKELFVVENINKNNDESNSVRNKLNEDRNKKLDMGYVADKIANSMNDSDKAITRKDYDAYTNYIDKDSESIKLKLSNEAKLKDYNTYTNYIDNDANTVNEKLAKESNNITRSGIMYNKYASDSDDDVAKKLKIENAKKLDQEMLLNKIKSSTHEESVDSDTEKHDSGNYEVFSGKIINDDADTDDSETINIFKKLELSTASFDKSGQISAGSSGSNKSNSASNVASAK